MQLIILGYTLVTIKPHVSRIGGKTFKKSRKVYKFKHVIFFYSICAVVNMLIMFFVVIGF